MQGNRRSFVSVIITLVILLALVFFLACCLGTTTLKPQFIIDCLTGNTTEDQASLVMIFREIRLPRVFLALVVGAALAVAGVAYQGLFRNPLAEPFIIGSASGAALGATIVILTGWLSSVSLGGFIGSTVTVFLSYAIFKVIRSENVTGLLLSGIAIGTMVNCFVWILMLRYDRSLNQIINWLSGSLANAKLTSESLWTTSIFTLIGIAIVYLLARPLDALSESETTAKTLGLPVNWTITLVILATSILTAISVSSGGIIGFIGLISPHIARRIVGESHAKLIPASALIGPILLISADLLARTVTNPVEMPVGILTGLLGGPFFLFILARRTI
jgi:iron complex transport system permease protein